MIERRGVLIAGATLALVVLLVAAWAAGRASAPDDGDSSGNASRGGGAVQSIDGVAVGVRQTRSGALAAADNYVAQATETAVQDPPRYEQLVRTVYSPDAQREALREGSDAREASPSSVALYARGGKTLAIVGARRLDSYTGTQASVTSWVAGFTWGPGQKPGQSWSLVETALRWDGQRWRVDSLDETSRPAPAPANVGFDERSALSTDTFDRELREMRAPEYGAG